MGQLRVLAGEPLHVIDFRYHLVSLIAVFLAVALGIVIGTTQLNGPVLTNVQQRVTALQQDKRSLEDTTQNLQAQVNSSDAFAKAVAPALVNGTLTGRKVLLVLTNDQVRQDTVDAVTALVGKAGGAVSGQVRLQSQYSDPASASSLQSYTTGPGKPAGITLPETDDAGKLVGSLLAQVLMAKPGTAGASGSSVSSVMAGLSALNVLTQESASIAPANYAVVLTAGVFQGSDAGARNGTLVDLASALDSAGAGAVVSGDTASSQTTGLVGVVRAAPTLSAAVSTVDNGTTAAGQVSTVLALGAEGGGTSGKYGTGQDTQPVPPVPTKP
jgi:hypothetical protein